VFEYFDSLKIGYVCPKNRKVRSYFKVYREVLIDVAYNAKGVRLNHFLKNMLPENEVFDVFSKISDNRRIEGRVPGDDETSLREFDHWYDQPGFMPHRHFVIHCHFAELGIGYEFRIQNIPGYVSPMVRSQQREQNRIMRTNPSNTGSINISLILKTDLLQLNYTRNSAFPIQTQMDYGLLKVDKPEVCSSDMCAICMETKDKTIFLTTECNHDFCNSCIGQMMVNSIVQSKSLDCPFCRQKMRNFKYSDETTIRNIIPKNVELSQSTLNSISI
jgi:hypothetical protein